MEGQKGHRAGGIAVTGAVAGLLVSCAAQANPHPAPAVPTVAAASSVAAVLGARVDAVAAYRGMWQAMAQAAQTSDWHSPELTHYASGSALNAITRSLQADQFNHVVTRGQLVNTPVVRSAEPPQTPDTVLIDDCGDTTHWHKYIAGTSTMTDQVDSGRRAITAEVTRQPDGSWRVSRFAVERLGSC